MLSISILSYFVKGKNKHFEGGGEWRGGQGVESCPPHVIAGRLERRKVTRNFSPTDLVPKIAPIVAHVCARVKPVCEKRFDRGIKIIQNRKNRNEGDRMNKAQEWSKSEESLLLQLRAEGYVWREIASRMRRGMGSVEKRFRKLKAIYGANIDKKSVESNDFYQMLRAGYSLEEIANKTGKNVDSVRRQIQLLKRDLPENDPFKDIPSGWSPAKWDEFLRRRKNGFTYPELSKIIGKNKRTLRTLYDKAEKGMYRQELSTTNTNVKEGNMEIQNVSKSNRRNIVGFWTPEDDKNLVVGVESGKSIRQIAQEIGRTERAVSQHFSQNFMRGENGRVVARERPLSKSDVDVKEQRQKALQSRLHIILKLQDEGKSSAEIGKVLKISRSRVYQLCKMANLNHPVKLNAAKRTEKEPIIFVPLPTKKVEELIAAPLGYTDVEKMTIGDIRSLIAQNQEKESVISHLRASLQDMEADRAKITAEIDTERAKRHEAEVLLEKASSDVAYSVSVQDFLDLIRRLPSLLTLPDTIAELRGSMEESSAKNATVLTQMREMECAVKTAVEILEGRIAPLLDLEKRLIEIEECFSRKLCDLETHIDEVKKSVSDIEDTITSPGKRSSEENPISPDFQEFLAESVARTAPLYEDSPMISAEDAKREADMLEVRGKKWFLPWKSENTTRHKRH